MKKIFIGAIIGIAILVGGVYILTPNTTNSNTTIQNNKNSNQYVTLESKGNINKENKENLPQGVTLTISAQAEQSGNVNYFKNEIKNKYMGDGSVEIYIQQVTGSLGGPIMATYDVNINGKEEMNLTATRTVTTQGYGTNIITTPIVFGSVGANN